LTQLRDLIMKMLSQLRSLNSQRRQQYESENENFNSEHGSMEMELRQIRDAGWNDPRFRDTEQGQKSRQTAMNVSVLLDEVLAVTNNTNTTGNTTNAMLAEHLQLINHINDNLDQINIEVQEDPLRHKVIAALPPKNNHFPKK
jgi:hypothetical protein